MRRKLIIATLISSFVLVGCGIKGDLKTPPPLWGDKKADQTETQDTDTTNSDPSG